MTETLESTAADAVAAPAEKAQGAKKRSGGLNSMLLADLKAMAGGMGITGAGGMKKAALVEAIKAAQAGGPAPEKAEQPKQEQPKQEQPKQEQPKQEQPKQEQPKQDQPKQDQPKQDQPKQDQPKQDQPKQEQPQAEQPAAEDGGRTQQGGQGEGPSSRRNRNRNKQNQQDQPKQDQPKQEQPKQEQPKQEQPSQQKQGQQAKQGQPNKADQQDQSAPDHPQDQGADHDDDLDGDGEGGSRRNRRRRGRDRANRATREPDTEVREDDILVPAAGILDVLDNYAFVRTSGYLAGADDVYLSLSMVRRYGLRRGDSITGQVRQPREGERREKFNPMVRIETVNGAEPEQATSRVDFDRLTPVSPSERLRLETTSDNLVGRVLDLVAPVGKGQRGLILSPAGAGKTTILQSVAAAVTANNPDTHLMVVLLDERPEEVTEFERTVKGEVVASTFDRPAADHTSMAELAIERAKRLVELGHDVVVLLDGITSLGRAYNLTAPPSGRVLPGGVDAAALFPPKKLFGAARTIENGGSLTILATATVESGSKLDEAILEEFTGTANLTIRLRREYADREIFPAIDPLASGTRRADLLFAPQEQAILTGLRRQLAERGGIDAVTHVLDGLRKTQTNYEFLMSVPKP